jgi:pantoate--beta-alanine ligase
MIVIHTIAELQGHLDFERAQGRTVGMMGTTGSLHDGHLSLVRHAKAENDIAVMFWTGDTQVDWAAASRPAYAPDMEKDLVLAEANGLDIFFVLSGKDLFPEPSSTFIALPSYAEAAGGLEDPNHLMVVATMVTTFLNIAGPCRAYFGEKDWQQLAMLQKLATDLRLPSEVRGCPTLREHDGVAISSRNQKLSPDLRAVAPIVYRALQATAQAAFDGEPDAGELIAIFTRQVELVASVHYARIVEAPTLAALERVDRPARMLVSVAFGDVRLVDNIELIPHQAECNSSSG